MNSKIECGLGVTISPTKRTEMGLEYSDYQIENKMGKNNGSTTNY